MATTAMYNYTAANDTAESLTGISSMQKVLLLGGLQSHQRALPRLMKAIAS